MRLIDVGEDAPLKGLKRGEKKEKEFAVDITKT